MAEGQKLAAATEAAKAATANATQAGEAVSKDTTNQDLVQAKEAADKAAGEANSQLQAATAANDTAQKAANDATAKAQVAAAEKTLPPTSWPLTQQPKPKPSLKLKQSPISWLPTWRRLPRLKNVNIFETSTSTLIRITNAPLTLTAARPAEAIKQGATVEIPVSAGRLYGFADALEVELIIPETAKGLSAAKAAIPGDKAEAKFALVAAADAAPGKHTLTARTKFKFGGADFQIDAPVAVEVEAAK